MKREFRDENFEEFLKHNADNLRMKAPERVWQNLSNELNKGRRRWGIGISAFLLTMAVLGYYTISNPFNPKFTRQPAATSINATSSLATQEANQGGKRSVALTKKAATSRKSDRAGEDFTRNRAPKRLTTPALPEVAAVVEKNDPTDQTAFSPTIVDDDPAYLSGELAERKPFSKPAFLTAHNSEPLSIESIMNLYRKKPSRFQTEFHFTPTISYRKLSENKSYLRSAQPFATAPNYTALYSSVNNMVTHKPDIGFELGVTEKYTLSKKLRIRAGVQFNVNRYDIKAFKAPYALATIALNTRGSSRLDSVFTVSPYSNIDASSNRSSWLQNLSFQVSTPVGFELSLKGNDKMQFGVATTVQPTYVLGDRAYLITNDYKSYTQVPWLLRRWNVNTALETFVSYKANKIRWQVGPQVRYQLLSSFISNYPVKENLFDFGLRIGVSVNK